MREVLGELEDVQGKLLFEQFKDDELRGKLRKIEQGTRELLSETTLDEYARSAAK